MCHLVSTLKFDNLQYKTYVDIDYSLGLGKTGTLLGKFSLPNNPKKSGKLPLQISINCML